MVKRLLAAVVVWKLLLILIVELSSLLLPLEVTFTPFRNREILPYSLPYPVVVFANFDGIHYLDIARRGYYRLEQPFFPFYPLVIRIVSKLTSILPIISSQIISIIAFSAGLYFVYKLLKFDQQKRLFSLLVLVILLFPTSYSYSASYNDALYFFLATLTLYLGRKSNWKSASVVAGLAVLTRLNGLALPFFLVSEYISQNMAVIKKWRLYKYQLMIDLGSFILIPLLAFLGYLLYVQLEFNDWNLIFSTMKIWGQDKVVLPMQTFWRYFKIVFVHPNVQITYLVALFEVISMLIYIMAAVYTFKRIRLSYWLFMCVSLLIPAFTGTFQGMPRYGLHLYPFFLGISLFLSNCSKLIRVVYFIASILLLIAALSLFSRGYFVA